nr:MAG TPA: transposase [Caudoviricetes sp.]
MLSYSYAKFEATNNLIKVIKRNAFVFQNFDNFRTRVLIALRVWDNSPFATKKQRICRCFLHGYDSLAKIELHNKPFRKAIPCTFTITQIKRLYH